MDRKMADRMLIRLSQLPERVGREKLEESDWVTFAVLVNKATPQSNSSVRPQTSYTRLISLSLISLSLISLSLISLHPSPVTGEDLQHLEAD